MATQGKLVALCLAMLAMLVTTTDAAFGSTSSSGPGSGSSFAMEFATPAGLAADVEDLRMSMYPATVDDNVEDEFLDEPTRRMLAAARRSYISYGALNGNRSPCPARSGRSYYTPNCNSQSGAAQPYRRGCYQITRCARG